MTKHTLIYLSLSLLLFGTYACQNDSKDSEETQTALPLPPNKSIAPPEELTSIFSPNTAVIRGFDWSSSPEDVRSKETAAPLADSGENEAAFTLDLNEEEFADITYRFNGQQMTAVQLDIYPADEAAADLYEQKLADFFNAKYKKRTELWEGAEKEQVFTVFLTKKNSDAGPFVTVIWEKESE